MAVTTFLNLLFPRRCVGCSREGSWLCESCEMQLVRDPKLEKVNQYTWAFYPFNLPIVRELLHNLKYNGVFEVADVLQKVTTLWLSRSQLLSTIGMGNAACLVPVPTSRHREKERGYNQAELLARSLGRWLQLSTHTELIGKKPSKSLVGKSAEDRRKQAGQSFILSEKADSWRGSEFIIVDDVLTTGSTANVCRDLLATLTNKPVKVLVFAHKN